MSKEMTIIALGVWVVIVPYLGFPGPWRTGILVMTGLCVVVVGFLLRAQTISKGTHRDNNHLFVENTTEKQDQDSHDHKERINSLN